MEECAICWWAKERICPFGVLWALFWDPAWRTIGLGYASAWWIGSQLRNWLSSTIITVVTKDLSVIFFFFTVYCGQSSQVCLFSHHGYFLSFWVYVPLVSSLGFVSLPLCYFFFFKWLKAFLFNIPCLPGDCCWWSLGLSTFCLLYFLLLIDFVFSWIHHEYCLEQWELSSF